VRRLAEQHGWVDPAKEHGASVAAALLNSHQREVTEKLTSAAPVQEVDAPDLMPSSGLIRDVAEYILSTSIRPQPRLAIAAATAFVATLAGRKFRTETGLMTNLYISALAESGHGKDQARKVINKLATDSGLDDYMGGDNLASGQAIVSTLERFPKKLFQLDEFGKFLGSIMGEKAAPHQRDIITKLMVLYSSAGSVYRGTEYADQKERPRDQITNPNACVYGPSVPEAFWGAMSSAESGAGTLSRLLIVEADPKRPKRQRPKPNDAPESLKQELHALAKYSVSSGNLSGRVGGSVDEPAQTVPMTDAVFDAWEALDDDMTESMTDTTSAALYSRVAENAAKLALVHAVSRNYHTPVIDEEAYLWGGELALWSANKLMHAIGRHVADNEQEAAHKRVLNAIKDAGEITRRDLLRQCRFLRKRELEEIITSAMEAGDVAVANVKNANGNKSTVYRALD